MQILGHDEEWIAAQMHKSHLEAVYAKDETKPIRLKQAIEIAATVSEVVKTIHLLVCAMRGRKAVLLEYEPKIDLN